MSQDSQPTSHNKYELGALFLPEWVIEIYYGGNWYQIEAGTYREVETEAGETVIYVDPFSSDLVILAHPVTGWKIKKPESEPKAEIIQLHQK